MFFSISAHAQIKFVGVGTNIGIGEIKGNTPSISSLSASILADVKTNYWEELNFRFAYHYARKVEYFLPNSSSNKIYPKLKLFSLQVLISQKFGENYFIEEGLGFSYLNDNTLTENSDWNLGTMFSGLIGIDFTEKDVGFKLGLGAEYAITFTNVNASYLSAKIQSFYYF